MSNTAGLSTRVLFKRERKGCCCYCFRKASEGSRSHPKSTLVMLCHRAGLHRTNQAVEKMMDTRECSVGLKQSGTHALSNGAASDGKHSLGVHDMGFMTG